MTTCTHLINRQCMHRDAMAYGKRPYPSICAVCPFYSGPKRPAPIAMPAPAVPRDGDGVPPSNLPSARRTRLRSWLRPVLVKRASSCSACKAPAIYRWLGIRWYGVPYQLRLRVQWPLQLRQRNPHSHLQWPIYAKPLPGCGCMVWAKTALQQLKFWFRYTYGDTTYTTSEKA